MTDQEPTAAMREKARDKASSIITWLVTCHAFDNWTVEAVENVRDAITDALREYGAAASDEMKERLEEYEAVIAGFMLEPGATVKPYIAERALEAWKQRRALEPGEGRT